MKENKLPFIALEGMCFSGKTSTAVELKQLLQKTISPQIVYNKGVFTESEIGQQFAKNLKKMSVGFSTVFYLADLMNDTKNVIKPKLSLGHWILQDRYLTSILSYRRAFSKYTNEYLDISEIIETFHNLNYLIKPSIEIYCIPPIECIIKRLKASKISTTVHDFYLKNPEFIRLVYEETLFAAQQSPNSIIVDTSKEVNFTYLFNDINTQLNS